MRMCNAPSRYMSYKYYDDLLQKLETLRPLESVSIQSETARLLIASIGSNTYAVNVWCNYDESIQVDQILRMQNVNIPWQSRSTRGSRSCFSFLIRDTENVAAVVAEIADGIDLQAEPVHIKNYVINIDVTNE